MNKINNTAFFTTRDELTKVCLDDVMYVTSEGNYLVIRLKSGRTLMLLASLTNFEQVIDSFPDVRFERIGRGYIVNTAYVSQVNSLRRTVTLADGSLRESVELVVSKDAIRSLKKTLEEDLHKVIPDFQTSNGNMEAYEATSP